MTRPSVPETWFSRDLPVLSAIVARVEAGSIATSMDIAADTGLDDNALERSARALEQAGYLPQVWWDGGGGWDIPDVSERARREVGAWPTAEVLATRLLDALERIATTSGSTDQRTAAGRLLDVAKTDGRGVLVAALGNIASGVTGLT